MPSEYVIHLRLCYPCHWRSLGYEGQGWWLHKVLMRLPPRLVLWHVSVSLWPSELEPRNPSGARSVWHCHYWTTYKCCGFTRLTTKRNRVSFSYCREAACTYLLEVKWSMKTWLTYQSNLATASKWNKACWLDANRRGDLWFFRLPSPALSFWVRWSLSFYDFHFPDRVLFFFLPFFFFYSVLHGRKTA